MANYPQDLAQDAMCHSRTGHMTVLWFLPTRPVRLNTNEWMINSNAHSNRQFLATAVIHCLPLPSLLFVGAFAKLRKATISFVMSVGLCAWNSSAPTGRIFMKTDTWVNLSIKSKLHYNLTRITGTLHAGRYTFIIISRSVLLRMRNVSDKSCRENRNTHFVFNNFFPKTVPFMR